MTIATTTEGVADGVSVDPEKVLSYLGLSPSDPKSQAVVAVAQRYDLDPLLKHVIVIPRGGVYITRDGLLHVAHRSGQLDGIVVDLEPTLSDDGKEWVSRVSVYRKDMRHPFTFPGRYAVNGGNKEYAQEMALKAAEAHALRRAFDVTGLPTLDEQRPAGEQVTFEQQTAPAADRMAAMLGTQTSGAEDAADVPPVASDERTDSSAPEPEAITSAQLTKVGILCGELGLTDPAEARREVGAVIGREIKSRKDLTKDEAHRVIEQFTSMVEQPFPPEPVDADVVEEPTA